MSRLEPILRRAIQGPCRIPRGGCVLVAASGGADSTALLLGLRRIAHERGVTLHAAHLHHGLRGRDADHDREFVRELCARLGIPVTCARWDTRRRMEKRGLSGQAGLRVLRREFLQDVARRTGAAVIATAHTADDQLETVLMRLLRGTGLPGLGGMQPRRGIWIKPMLGATRAMIEAELGRLGQTWREDRSNLDLAYFRNRVRHVAIPALVETLGRDHDPGARSALARSFVRTASEARSGDRALRAWVDPVLRDASRIQSGQIELDSVAIRSYPFAFRRTVLRMSWKRLRPMGPGLTHRHLRGLDRLLAKGAGGSRVLLPGGGFAERDRDRVRIRIGAPVSIPEPVSFAIPSQARWGRHIFRGQWTSGAGARRRLGSKPEAEEYFAAEELKGTLELRAGRADEEFVPFGRTGPVRLGDFLRKQGVTRDRLGPGVLADSGGILWVIGVRRSARAPVTAGTRRALRVHTERP